MMVEDCVVCFDDAGIGAASIAHIKSLKGPIMVRTEEHRSTAKLPVDEDAAVVQSADRDRRAAGSALSGGRDDHVRSPLIRPIQKAQCFARRRLRPKILDSERPRTSEAVAATGCRGVIIALR